MDYKRNLWTAVVVLIAGIVLVCFYPLVPETFVMIVGGMFLCAALVNLLMQFSKSRSSGDKKSKGSSMTTVLTAIAAGALGLWMLIDPHSLVNLLVYIFGAIVILAGVYQICTLALGFRPIRFPFGFYVLPVLMVACGIAVFILGPDKVSNGLALLIGIVMIVYAISMFIEVGGITAFQRSLRNNGSVSFETSDGHGGTIDVKAEDVSSKPDKKDSESAWPADKHN